MRGPATSEGTLSLTSIDPDDVQRSGMNWILTCWRYPPITWYTPWENQFLLMKTLATTQFPRESIE